VDFGLALAAWKKVINVRAMMEFIELKDALPAIVLQSHDAINKPSSPQIPLVQEDVFGADAPVPATNWSRTPSSKFRNNATR
jgi:hypothetical protein